MATFRTITIRVTEVEGHLIRAGAIALGISKSTLVSTAATIAYHQLGFFEDGRRSPPAWSAWKDAPHRERGSLDDQIVISLNPMQYALSGEAAQWSQVPVTSFLVGATMRFLATCKEAQSGNAKLGNLSLPPEYELPKKRARRG